MPDIEERLQSGFKQIMTEDEAEALGDPDQFAVFLDDVTLDLSRGSLLDSMGNALVLAAELRIADGKAKNLDEKSRAAYLNAFRTFVKDKNNASLAKKTLDAYLTFALPKEWKLETMSEELASDVLSFYREKLEELRQEKAGEYERTANMLVHILEKAEGQAKPEGEYDVDDLLKTWGEEVDYPKSLIEGIRQMMTESDREASDKFVKRGIAEIKEKLQKEESNRE